MKDAIPIPVVAKCEPAPPGLIGVIQCQCKSRDNICFTESCGCLKEHLYLQENPQTHKSDKSINEEETEVDDIVGEDAQYEDQDLFANQEDIINEFIDQMKIGIRCSML